MRDDSRDGTSHARPPRRAQREPPSLLLRGALAGVAAMGVTALADRALDPLVSRRQKLRDRLLRPGRPHEIAGPTAARKILGRALAPRERSAANAAFDVAYGVGWGIAYTWIRRRVPAASRYGGLTFAVPFFLLCDAVIAPMLRLTPGAERVPWQMNAKELGNHVAWTAGAEAANRLVERATR